MSIRSVFLDSSIDDCILIHKKGSNNFSAFMSEKEVLGFSLPSNLLKEVPKHSLYSLVSASKGNMVLKFEKENGEIGKIILRKILPVIKNP